MNEVQIIWMPKGRSAWLYLVMFVFVLCLLRGVRFPNLWGYTHFLFNYDFGFSKRALVGPCFRGSVRHFGSPMIFSAFLASAYFF